MCHADHPGGTYRAAMLEFWKRGHLRHKLRKNALPDHAAAQRSFRIPILPADIMLHLLKRRKLV